tara:strand:- start:2146 stop:2508 length:363 start_codon:yes stop_codon:yes gene_type:complete
MIKVTTGVGSQDVYFIPNSFLNNTTIKVISDITNADIVPTSTTLTHLGDYLKCELVFPAAPNGLVNNNFYTFSLLDNLGEPQYIDKLICTDDFDSTSMDWDINEGQYKEFQTPNNDYLVI